MSTETMIPKPSAAELRQMLADAEREERAAKDKQRDAYESLKNSTIENLCMRAIRLKSALSDFKSEAFSDMQTVYKMLQEYSSRHSDSKGNFRIENGNFRIVYKRQGRPTFDEKADQAEKHIIDFVNSKYAVDADTRDLIMSLLERKKGELDISLIQKLYAMEHRFEDQNWKRGIELLKESYHYSHSKDYMQFEQRNEIGEWNAIYLNFASI